METVVRFTAFFHTYLNTLPAGIFIPAAEYKGNAHDTGYGLAWHGMARGIQTGRCAGQNFKVVLAS